MNYGAPLPKFVRDRMLVLDGQFKRLSEQVRRTKDAIDATRQRITGKFETDQQYEDAYSTLKKMIADLPALERKCAVAEGTLDKCEAFLERLPDDVALEAVAVDTGDLTLDVCNERIDKIEDELKELRAAPLLHGDIEATAQTYVKKLAQPRVSGISKGEELKVVWPNDLEALLAIMFPEKMVEVIVAEAGRMASTPMPLPQRQTRIGQLERELDRRRRQAFKLGAPDTYDTPAEVILGVKVVRSSVPKSPKPKMKVAPRATAAEA